MLQISTIGGFLLRTSCAKVHAYIYTYLMHVFLLVGLRTIAMKGAISTSRRLSYRALVDGWRRTFRFRSNRRHPFQLQQVLNVGVFIRPGSDGLPHIRYQVYKNERKDADPAKQRWTWLVQDLRNNDGHGWCSQSARKTYPGLFTDRVNPRR